jgi:hypothetical protein
MHSGAIQIDRDCFHYAVAIATKPNLTSSFPAKFEGVELSIPGSVLPDRIRPCPRRDLYHRPASYPMAIQIVMDHTGDTRRRFDAADCAAVEEARQRFLELTNAGFAAAVRTGPANSALFAALIPWRKKHCFIRDLWAADRDFYLAH